jgi:hypothetical protein
MSEIELEAGSADHPVRVIITSEGELLTPNDELTYDLALQAMGGPETDLIKVYQKWVAYPVQTIIEDFGVPRPAKDMLLVDSAEHVLHIRDRHVDTVQANLSRRIIEQCRIAIATDGSAEATQTLGRLLHMLARPDTTREHRMYNASVSVYDAIWYAAHRSLGEAVLFHNFNPACDAAGYVADPYKYSGPDQSRTSPAFQRAFHREELWEIAHFVELMGTLYHTVRDDPSKTHK